MDVQTGLVYVAVVVISALVIGFVSMFAIKEKSYEEAIAEQRRLPDDLLGSKKDKGKEKKLRNKTGKKGKDKKDEKEEKFEHAQLEELTGIPTPEMILQGTGKIIRKKSKVEKIKPTLIKKDETLTSSPENDVFDSAITKETNNFEYIQHTEDLEIIKRDSHEDLASVHQTDSSINKSPKNIPIKTKKAIRVNKKKDEHITEDNRESPVMILQNKREFEKEQIPVRDQNKEGMKIEIKEPRKEITQLQHLFSKDTKKMKKKNNDILSQIGSEKDGVNMSLLLPLIQKAELSRSEIQDLIDKLLNKQQDNPQQHSEWMEGRADPVLKLRKQISELENTLKDEREACLALQNKLKELRSELNIEKSRNLTIVRHNEELISVKATEIQALHTRVQHILESHVAEKQGFNRQIEQLQTKLNEDAALIHKLQEQVQSHNQLQQELVTLRKQMDLQFNQMRDNENALKTQLAQKHVENQELQNHNLTISQELQATCETSNQEIQILREQLTIMEQQLMHSEAQLQHYKENSDRLQDLHHQMEESRCAQNDVEKRMKTMIMNEQDLKKQITVLHAELEHAKCETEEVISLRLEMKQLQSELTKYKGKKSVSENDYEGKDLKRDEDNEKMVLELNIMRGELKKSRNDMKKLESELAESRNENQMIKSDLMRTLDNLNLSQNDLIKSQEELREVQQILAQTRAEFSKLQVTPNTFKDQKISELQSELLRLKDDKDKLAKQLISIGDLQNELKGLRENNDHLSSQITALKERGADNSCENGIEGNNSKTSMQLSEYTRLLAQKEDQLSLVKTELTQKKNDFDQLELQVELWRSDINNQHNTVQRLQTDLEIEKSKTNDVLQKIVIEHHRSTQTFLQRIFPEINISAHTFEEWIQIFEEKVQLYLLDMKNESGTIADLEKQNKSLQSMTTNLKKIIYETEGMLKSLESHVESKEEHWQAQLRIKENENVNLRVELNDLQNRLKNNSEVCSAKN